MVILLSQDFQRHSNGPDTEKRPVARLTTYPGSRNETSLRLAGRVFRDSINATDRRTFRPSVGTREFSGIVMPLCSRR